MRKIMLPSKEQALILLYEVFEEKMGLNIDYLKLQYQKYKIRKNCGEKLHGFIIIMGTEQMFANNTCNYSDKLI